MIKLHPSAGDYYHTKFERNHSRTVQMQANLYVSILKKNQQSKA